MSFGTGDDSHRYSWKGDGSPHTVQSGLCLVHGMGGMEMVSFAGAVDATPKHGMGISILHRECAADLCQMQ